MMESSANFDDCYKKLHESKAGQCLDLDLGDHQDVPGYSYKVRYGSATMWLARQSF